MRRLLVLALLLLSTAAFAQDDKFLDAMDAVRTFHSAAIAPDGKHVAWAQQKGGITIANADGSSPRRLTTGDEEGVAWSPDSRSVAWAGGPPAQRQVYVATIAGTPRQLSGVKGYVAEPRWSPDGRQIAFLYIENAKRAAGPLVAMSRAVGPIDEQIEEQRIAVIDVATKALRILTPADMYVYHFDWSPDGRRMAAIAAPGSGDDNYWIAQLHVVDVA